MTWNVPWNVPQEDDIILRCVEPGPAQEGEPCLSVDLGWTDLVCAADLRCVLQRCAAVCDDDSDCCEGSRCASAGDSVVQIALLTRLFSRTKSESVSSARNNSVNLSMVGTDLPCSYRA